MVLLPLPVTHLAQRQLGVIARWQLRGWLSADQVDGLVQRRTFVRLERGVYRLRGSAVVPVQAPIAAALRVGAGVAVTGPAVLGHLGVDGFDPGGPFEVLVPEGRRLQGVRFRWRVDPHPARSFEALGAVRLTRPGDALVHAVHWREELGDRTLKLGFHWLCWHDHLDRRAFVARLVARSALDPSAAALLELIGGAVAAACESDGEVVLGALLGCFTPAPLPQFRIGRRRVDWFFVTLRLAIEYDGQVDHSGPTDTAADAVRDAELGDDEVQVLRVTAADLRDEEALIARLVTAMVLRARELGVAAPTFRPASAAAEG